jgi:pimeloyl-ACP methyl ester carboxylesterase
LVVAVVIGLESVGIPFPGETVLILAAVDAGTKHDLNIASVILTAADRERFAAMNTLVKQGWGADNSAYRQIFTSLMMPAATKDQPDAFNELRLSGSPECAVRYMETTADFDVRELLSQVKAPTLVMHVRDDPRVSSDLGRELAAGIPGAKFVVLPGKNHLLLEQDPGLPRFFEELKDFLKNAT